MATEFKSLVQIKLLNIEYAPFYGNMRIFALTTKLYDYDNQLEYS